jgi:outer membrane protein OmpA-like peptidoglycan-associated protein
MLSITKKSAVNSANLLMKFFVIISCVASLNACVTAPQLYSEQPVQSRDLHDDDLDGVINERDLCEQTPVDASISNEGCPTLTTRPKVKYRVIKFAFDKSTLSLREVSRVQEIATFLKKYPETNLYLIGDTSTEGSDAYNKKLATKRVNTVHQLLMNNNINKSRLKTESYGYKNHLPKSLQGRKTRLIAVLAWPKNVKDYQVDWSIFTDNNNDNLINSASK